MDQQGISARLYNRIGEVARLTGLKPSVLRFWETEFPEIAPQKSPTGQRLYSRESIALIQQIKEMLYKEKLTIAGARTRLRQQGRKRSDSPAPVGTDELVADLLEIRKMLSEY